MYYRYNKLFSYNTRFMCVIGARGIGKTYGAKLFVIKKFLCEKKKFIWLRDTDTAVEELCKNKGQNFFVDIKKEFHTLDGTIKDTAIIINGDHAGYVVSLSTFYKYKGNSYEDIEYIIFDEFIPENDQVKRGNRALQFINTIESIARLRTNIRVLLLANSLSLGDNILNLFNVRLTGFGYYVKRRKDCVIHYSDNDPTFNIEKLKSLTGILVRDTPLGDSIVENKFRDDGNLFFVSKPANCKFLCCLHSGYASTRLVFHANGTVYACVDNNLNSNSNSRYVGNINLVNTRFKLIHDNIKKVLIQKFSESKVMFENAMVKTTFKEVLF